MLDEDNGRAFGAKACSQFVNTHDQTIGIVARG